jgi:hypothetical protein
MPSTTDRRSLRLAWIWAAVLLLLAFLASGHRAAAQVSSPTAEEAVYRDPGGRFVIPVPTNWTAEEFEGFVRVATDDGKIALSVAVIDGTSASSAIEETMRLLEPSFDATPIPGLVATPSSGSDDIALYTYDDGSASSRLEQAYAQRIDGHVFVLVLQGDLEAVELRQVQVDKIRFGIQVFPDAFGTPVATPLS